MARVICGGCGIATGVFQDDASACVRRFEGGLSRVIRLSIEESKNLKSQFVTSSWGGARKPISAFTEQGVAMLSSVLKSERAIQVNLHIMRAFTRLRQMISSHEDLRRKIEAMEKKYDGQFRIVFDAIKELLRIDSNPKKKIGF